MRKSFILHLDSLSVLDELTDEQAGILFKAIKDYQNGINPQLDFGMRMAFVPFENYFIRDTESYNLVCEKNRINGKKGGRPKNQNKPIQTEKTQVVISKPKKADNDNDNDNDNKSNIIPPLWNDVLSYCMERKNGVDINKWFNFYESKGWMVGKTKMKDWKASIRTWESSKDEQNKNNRYIPPIVHE